MIKNELEGSDIAEAYFVYDGDCAVCQGTFDYFMKLELPAVLRGVKYQFEEELLQKYGLSPALCDRHAYTSVQIQNHRLEMYKGCDSIFALMKLQRKSRLWRLLGCVASFPPINLFARLSYRIFADNRGRVSKLFYGNSCKL